MDCGRTQLSVLVRLHTHHADSDLATHARAIRGQQAQADRRIHRPREHEDVRGQRRAYAQSRRMGRARPDSGVRRVHDCFERNAARRAQRHVSERSLRSTYRPDKRSSSTPANGCATRLRTKAALSILPCACRHSPWRPCIGMNSRALRIHIVVVFLHIGRTTSMRTNIDIDDRLMNQAMRHSTTATKKATVEAALRLFVETHAQTSIRRLKGKVRWEGDLNRSRRGRVRD